MRPERRERYPSLGAREHWGRYAAGILVESAFSLGLIALGLALAALATVIWK